MPFTPPLTKKVLGSPSQYPADLQSWMAKVISGNNLFQIDWPQLPGPKITSQAIASGPPKAPTNGDIWIATGVDANGTVWQFRYNAKSASAYKWEFIGGSEYNWYDGGGVARNNTVNATWEQVAGSATFTLVRGGDYRVTVRGTHIVTAAGVTLNAAIGPVAAPYFATGLQGVGNVSLQQTGVAAAVAANQVVGISMLSSAFGNTSLSYHGYTIVPVRVS